MWRSYISIPIENQDPFKSLNDGAIGIAICFDRVPISVELKKDIYGNDRMIRGVFNF